MNAPLVITRPEEAGVKGFDKVFAFLRDQLLSGAIRPGDLLIPERELATQLKVSRPSLREALRALAVIGVVEIRHGVGTIVRRPDASVLGEFFTFALAHKSDVIEDVMEARIAIECQAIRLACQRAAASDLERVRAELANIAATIGDPEKGGRADYEFHLQLVRAAKSETLLGMYQAISELLLRSHLDRRALVRASAGMREYLIEDHRRIYDALAERDPQKADAVLRKHFAIGDEYRRKAARDDIGIEETKG
ncbi:MAG: FadR family transcriptional regulator [Alphaproteobacteria bacterium]|nr:FadR family transcriptional regulator [Alphaproteobacteria bacterium]